MTPSSARLQVLGPRLAHLSWDEVVYLGFHGLCAASPSLETAECVADKKHVNVAD